ncbi:uncharacterized protein TRUGW13939_05790 [Talaromyces rugulosus]|uniref:Helicase C-terminal domain-containing protein n=1 Tax=Talaromyces rugulosus TaxID=121627 RepID=A0A7H8R198_TALRU|nr:uncharacterized protein TRUGW13939_05790 [Talaromyces rugulosus]QKX58663.1 hypothetical protein TRUGW13939_05790 [Talaromyces rugulosus]
MVYISLNSAQDTVAVLVSETLSGLVREFAVTMNATLCGKKQKAKYNNMGPRFLSVRIVLYGFLQQKDAIADALAGGGLFLQHPGETEYNRNVKHQIEALVMMVEKEEGIYEKTHFPTIWKVSTGLNGQSWKWDWARRCQAFVVPKSVIHSWEKQIKNHIHPEKIRWITYYGSNRQETASDISSCDAARKAWKDGDEKLLTRTILETNVKQCIFCYSDVEGENGGGLVFEELDCGHVLCETCATKLQSTDGQLSCLHCSVDKLQLLSSPRREQLPPARLTNPGGLRSSPSAKLKAILHNISQRQEPNVQHSKVVIFSYWTRMLDLIGNALDERQLPFQRIDGQRSLSQRKEALEKFGNDPQCNIMLASIGAAGEGIDLTAATSVHIVEPHWNPMAESQAIDRVHRIGQKHDVEVVRYIVDESIEKYIQWVQNYKLRMINESLSESEQNLQASEVRWKKLLEFLE